MNQKNVPLRLLSSEYMGDCVDVDPCRELVSRLTTKYTPGKYRGIYSTPKW